VGKGSGGFGMAAFGRALVAGLDGGRQSPATLPAPQSVDCPDDLAGTTLSPETAAFTGAGT